MWKFLDFEPLVNHSDKKCMAFFFFPPLQDGIKANGKAMVPGLPPQHSNKVSVTKQQVCHRNPGHSVTRRSTQEIMQRLEEERHKRMAWEVAGSG